MRLRKLLLKAKEMELAAKNLDFIAAKLRDEIAALKGS
jgi:excinuclease UvrABC helicase subunit UvrB